MVLRLTLRRDATPYAPAPSSSSDVTTEFAISVERPRFRATCVRGEALNRLELAKGFEPPTC